MKDFNVYKWRREQINEEVSNEVLANKVYDNIKKYLSKEYQDISYKNFITSSIIRAMSLKEETENKLSPDELFTAFKQLTRGAGSHYPNEKTIKVTARYAPDDKEAKSFFSQNGYDVEIKEFDEEPGERVGEKWYIYK